MEGYYERRKKETEQRESNERRIWNGAGERVFGKERKARGRMKRGRRNYVRKNEKKGEEGSWPTGTQYSCSRRLHHPSKMLQSCHTVTASRGQTAMLMIMSMA